MRGILQRPFAPVAILLSLAGLSGQNSLVSVSQLSFRMVNLGVVPDPQALHINAAPGTNWTVSLARDPASETPWLVLNGGNGPVTGSGPGSVQVGLRGWMAEAKAAGSYDETVVITPQNGRPVNITVAYTVVPRLPGPAFRYLSGPVGCKQTRDFPDADTCVIPRDWPNPMPAPAKGSSYRDPNFAATVHVLTDPGCNHPYSTPTAISAGNTHVLVWCKDRVEVLDARSGNVVYTPPSHNRSARWDARDDNVYYYMEGAVMKKVNVATRQVSTLVDYSKDPHHFSKIESGGTADTSKDNWNPFWAPNEHQICVVDLDHARTYCADYTRIPGPAVTDIDFSMIAKGIDRPTGKRYVLLVAMPALAVFSVNQPAGKLDFEYRGPEDPEGHGNHDGVCDPGEKCLGTPHTDTLEDSAGIQYLVINGQAAPCELALATYRLNAGPKILLPVELGGGRKRIMAIDKCSGPGPWPKDDHIGCAKTAPYCAISLTYNAIKNVNDRTPLIRTPHQSELFVMRDNGTEILRLAELRSLRFTQDGDDGYWTQSRACLSNDASLVIADTNFSEQGKVRVITVETGIGKPSVPRN
jgi:hypothetical protein